MSENTATQCALPERLTPKDTVIASLGPARVASPLKFGCFVPDDSGVLLDIAVTGTPKVKGGKPVTLEQAGPRETIYFDPTKTKCAVVTCGGLCPGLNDVIRSITLSAHHNYGVAGVLGIRYGLEGFIPKYGHEVMELTPDNVASIHEFGGTVLGTSRGPQPAEEIVDALERLNVSVLFVIGGDGSMRAAAKIQAEIDRRRIKIAVIGVPKTIDNDINFVSPSFGFSTAVEQATIAIGCAHVEATGSPCGVGMVKVMGREAGFIAAEATLASKEVNFVLIPEDGFDLDGGHGLLALLEQRLREREHAVVVVAEGAGQHLLKSTDETDASGNPVLGDVADLLVKRIKAHAKARDLDLTLKFIDPSYIIRSVPANSNDRVYCGFLGQMAVHAGMAGKTGMVVSRWNAHYVHIPLSLVTAKRKKIDISSNYWRSVLETTGQPQRMG